MVKSIMEFIPKEKKPKSNKFCSVYGCSSRASKCPQLAFHTFPPPGSRKVIIENKFGVKEFVDIRKAWEKVLKMGKPSTKFMNVCSLHFKESDYFPLSSKAKRKVLKKTAVPSMNLPKTSHPTPTKKKRSDRPSRRISESTVAHQVRISRYVKVNFINI